MFCSRCGNRVEDQAASCPLCGFSFRGDAPGVTLGITRTAVVAPVAYAGFWRRFTALLIDLVVTYFPIATVRVLLGLSVSASFDPVSASSWWAACFELGFDWLYAAVLIASSWRGTLGQQVMDLHVTDLVGNRVSFARATWRWAAQCLNLATLGFGVLMMMFSPRRQCLHDLASGTVVVRPRPATRPELTPVMRLVP